MQNGEGRANVSTTFHVPLQWASDTDKVEAMIQRVVRDAAFLGRIDNRQKTRGIRYAYVTQIGEHLAKLSRRYVPPGAGVILAKDAPKVGAESMHFEGLTWEERERRSKPCASFT